MFGFFLALSQKRVFPNVMVGLQNLFLFVLLRFLPVPLASRHKQSCCSAGAQRAGPQPVKGSGGRDRPLGRCIQFLLQTAVFAVSAVSKIKRFLNVSYFIHFFLIPLSSLHNKKGNRIFGQTDKAAHQSRTIFLRDSERAPSL